MKRTHALIAVLALMSMTAAAQTAVAGEPGTQSPSPGQQRAMLLDLNGGSQPAAPAEWRADRYLATPSLNMAGGQQAQAQSGTQPAAPAEWRADRYLAVPSLNMRGGQSVQAQMSTVPMIPAEWRADHFLAMPSMADAGDQRIRQSEMSVGSC